MKSKLFLIPVMAGAMAITTGCQTGSSDSTHQPISTAATATSPAPAVSPAPASAVAPATTQAPTIRINAGAGAVKDAKGTEWSAETGFEGGDVIERPDLPIANTQQPEIYRSEHYAMDAFRQKLPNGKYNVKLHFCETFEGISGPGERVFSFDVEGRTFKDFDVWAKSGGAARAYVETVPVEITDGELTIKFTSQVENPQINAIEIIPAQ